MKLNRILLAIVIIITFSNTLFSQLEYNSSGRLGINCSPAYTLDVNGTGRFNGWTDVVLDWTGPCCASPVLYPENDYYLFLGKETNRINFLHCWGVRYANGLYKYSDERLKKNIAPIGEATKKLMMFEGIQYNLVEEGFGTNLPENIKTDIQESLCYGYSAQSVEKYFPELVAKDKDSLGLLSVDYLSIIPLITEAMKEQQVQLETLKTIVYSQEKEIIKLNKQVEKLIDNDSNSGSDSNNSSKEKSALMQNTPNPFVVNTEIEYFISKQAESAKLIIHDLNGLEKMSFNIKSKGYGTHTIEASQLDAGMYLYTLLVDGDIIDSKRMILTNE